MNDPAALDLLGVTMGACEDPSIDALVWALLSVLVGQSEGQFQNGFTNAWHPSECLEGWHPDSACPPLQVVVEDRAFSLRGDKANAVEVFAEFWSAHQRVWPTPRPADNGELHQVEVVRDLADVARPIDYLPVKKKVGPTDAWAINRDDANRPG